MPSKKKRYNSRFPPARIKKIMQTDEEIGKVAAAVPVIISRTIEMLIQSLLSRAGQVTISKNVRTLTPSHLKQSILAQPRLSFMLDLCKDIPDTGNDQILEDLPTPSNSSICQTVKEEITENQTIKKESKLKRSISAPECNMPKRKRGRPRKMKSFVDTNNDENDAHNTVQNSFHEDEKKDSRETKKLPSFNKSVSNLSLSDMETKKEDKSFLENIKISGPGFGSSSLTIDKPVKDKISPAVVSPTSFNPFSSSTNDLHNLKSDVDEDYD